MALFYHYDLDLLSLCVHETEILPKVAQILGDFWQLWVPFTWQQKIRILGLGFESFEIFLSPAKFAKRFESSNQDSRIRPITRINCKAVGIGMEIWDIWRLLIFLKTVLLSCSQ